MLCRELGFQIATETYVFAPGGTCPRFPFGILAVAGTLLMINGYFLLVHLPLE